MKQAIRLALPLSVISFAIFTKWWYVLVVDGPEEILIGFPLPFVCSGWHTSMSLQFFLAEFIVDLLTYFLVWLMALFFFGNFWVKIKTHKIFTIGLYSLAIFITIGASIIITNPDNTFYLNRHFDVKVMETGYKFTWQNTDRPDFNKYYPEGKDEQKEKLNGY